MEEKVKKKNILTSFPRTFWVANLMELFERAFRERCVLWSECSFGSLFS
jgi:hypothetical protein